METAEEPTPIHPETLQEKPPEAILNIYAIVVGLLADFGWYLFLAVGMGVVLWSWARPHVERWQRRKEEREEDARRHKNPDLYRTRQLAMEVARLRSQAEHDERAKVAAEKEKEREAVKLRERMAKQSGISTGQRLNAANTTGQAGGTVKPEYNPLMGGGSSSGYRPSPRSCPGGGCG